MLISLERLHFGASDLQFQIFRFPKTILRDKCSASYDLASLFRGRIASFLTRSTSKTEDVSHNCCIVSVVNLAN